ncbi:MAG: BglG family transcription antiterminator [Halanaerobiales bacterium]|nr:BglG family transcription antiterminator [Halanaerobiales bacterium]
MKIDNLTSREKKIVKILINKNDYLTVKELAEELGVSKRTISREMASLKKSFKDSDLNIISKPSVGTTVTAKKGILKQYQKKLNKKESISEYSPAGRKRYIIKQFIFSDRFQKLTALAHQLAVTEATISYDLNRVAEWFEKRGLELNRKQGIGVFLEGSEEKFRRAVIDFLYEDFGEEKVLDIIRNNVDNNINKSGNEKEISKTKLDILNFISYETSNKIEKSINQILKQNDFQMVNSSYIGLLIHLALAVKRLENNEEISIESEKLEKLKRNKEYKLAEKIAAKLEKVFELTIPEDEKAFITMHLKGAKIRKNVEMIEEPLADEELEAIKLARMLVREVENKLKVKLADDYNLISGLTTHLEPAVSRLEMGMEIRNPILKDLKREYSDIFKITKEAAAVLVEELNCEIPDSEIGYLTMHIASALENADFYFSKINTLVVCSSGIGSSRILAARLKKTLDQLEITAETSALNIEKHLENNQIDLIISTVNLDKYAEKTVVVSPVLVKEDIRKINNKIKQININKAQQKKTKSITAAEGAFEKRLELTSRLSNDILKLIREFKVIEFDKLKNYQEIFKKICSDNYLPDSFDSTRVYQALVEREKKGATIIPEMQLALLHGRSEGVDYPFISLVKLKKPLTVRNNKNESVIDRIIVLLAPEKMLKEEINLLSKFSSSIIENENFSQIISRGSREEFLKYFKELMSGYFNDFMIDR